MKFRICRPEEEKVIAGLIMAFIISAAVEVFGMGKVRIRDCRNVPNEKDKTVKIGRKSGRQNKTEFF